MILAFFYLAQSIHLAACDSINVTVRRTDRLECFNETNRGKAKEEIEG